MGSFSGVRSAKIFDQTPLRECCCVNRLGRGQSLNVRRAEKKKAHVLFKCC
jgi:hypothetical protein